MKGESYELCFNSQPRKGADSNVCRILRRMGRFNSQPRKGADDIPDANEGDYVVSTHSPARGLTRNPNELTTLDMLFQLTAPQGG